MPTMYSFDIHPSKKAKASLVWVYIPYDLRKKTLVSVNSLQKHQKDSFVFADFKKDSVKL